MSQYSTSSDFDVQPPPSKGMAVSGLVVSIIGCCVPLLGFVGIILGIVAMVRAKSDARRYGGGGIALGAIIVGALSLLVSILAVVLIGISLPAVAKARGAARQAVVSTHMKQIGMGLFQYADDNRGWLPEEHADLASRLSQYGVQPSVFQSPRAPAGAADAFVYLAPGSVEKFRNPSVVVVMHENPAYVEFGSIVVLFGDGHVAPVREAEFRDTLAASNAALATDPAPIPKPPGRPRSSP